MMRLLLDEEGMAWGNELLHFAVATVDVLRTNEERVALFTELYPWSTERLLDPGTAGSPPTEADAVVAYWEALWRRLQGTADFDRPVAMMTPSPGSFGHALTSEKPEGRLQLAFAHGVRADTLSLVTVRTAGGDPVPVTVDHFYGDLSHAVLARPQEDWEPDTDYVVTVAPGVTDYDGLVSTVPWTATFSTRPPPSETPTPRPTPDPTPSGCLASVARAGVPSAAGLAWIGLVGLWLRRRRISRPPART